MGERLRPRIPLLNFSLQIANKHRFVGHWYSFEMISMKRYAKVAHGARNGAFQRRWKNLWVKKLRTAEQINAAQDER
jgi:hypothetical protein